MSTVQSQDGTTIGFDRIGEGPVVIWSVAHFSTSDRPTDGSAGRVAVLRLHRDQLRPVGLVRQRATSRIL
jgi:hypothetical protein